MRETAKSAGYLGRRTKSEAWWRAWLAGFGYELSSAGTVAAPVQKLTPQHRWTTYAWLFGRRVNVQYWYSLAELEAFWTARAKRFYWHRHAVQHVTQWLSQADVSSIDQLRLWLNDGTATGLPAWLLHHVALDEARGPDATVSRAAITGPLPRCWRSRLVALAGVNGQSPDEVWHPMSERCQTTLRGRLGERVEHEARLRLSRIGSGSTVRRTLRL